MELEGEIKSRGQQGLGIGGTTLSRPGGNMVDAAL
jgi:hypothetical protein